MPPRLDQGKLGRLDGDHQKIKDYDIRENEQKKKVAWIYTKQELDQKKQHDEKLKQQLDQESQQNYGSAIRSPNSLTVANMFTTAQTGTSTNHFQSTQFQSKEGAKFESQKALVKPKNVGQFDQSQVAFSYVQNPVSKQQDKKDKKKQTEKELEEQEQKLKEEFERDVSKKLQKKSKNAMIEVPMYLTQEELMGQFQKNKNQLQQLHQERQKQYYSQFDQEFQGNDTKNLNDKFKNIGQDDIDDEMEFDNLKDEIEEDMFLKGEIPKAKDPFSNKLNQYNKNNNKKEDGSKTTDNSYDSGATSASQFRSNNSKYNRLPNGLIMNHDKEQLIKQNDMLAKVNLRIAKNKVKNGEVQLPISMIDSKSISQFYSYLFSYAPCILENAASKGDEFERFKLTLKFAFSILHNLTFQDVFQKSPLRPLPGETFEGHYIYHNVSNVFMESDFLEFDYVDKLTLKDVNISIDDPTTYIHIESPGKYEIFGNLTYQQKWKGNNMVITLPGILNVKFFDQEGADQIIEFQLPEYILSGYYYVGKPAMILINGPLVVVDKKNEIKSVVLFQGLLTEKNLCGVEYVANTRKDMKIVQGLIYKYNPKKTQQFIDKCKTFNIENIKDLYDVDYKLERIQGNAIDYYEIEEVPQSDWKNLDVADPIPSEIALPSDMRFREDLIWLNREDKGKGKVWRGMMKEQAYKDLGGSTKKGGKVPRKKPKRAY